MLSFFCSTVGVTMAQCLRTWERLGVPGFDPNLNPFKPKL